MYIFIEIEKECSYMRSKRAAKAGVIYMCVCIYLLEASSVVVTKKQKREQLLFYRRRVTLSSSPIKKQAHQKANHCYVELERTSTLF